MASESLLEEVEAKRKKTIESLESEYGAKKQEVLKRAEEQKTYLTQSSNNEAAAASQRESVRITGAAKLQAKKMLFDATETMLENNIASLRRVLGELADSKDYPDLLSRMLAHASKRLGGEPGIICRPADAAVLKRAGARILASNLNAMGGFKAESRDGTLELDLTFEELLRTREEEVRAFILGKE